MYVSHEFNVTPWIKKGSDNVLAVRFTPEQKVQNVNGVELADSWFDWINWKYLGYSARPDDPGYGSITSFVPDRNAGIWKPVYLRLTGSVSVNNAMVNSDLSLTDSIARLTVFADLHNLSAQPVNGILKGTILRKGKPSIHFEQSIKLASGEERELEFTPEKFPELIVKKPDLWWPYTMGTPALYDLHLEFEQGDNEQIPTLESLKKFIPEDKLWPIDDTWSMHAGAWPNNCSLGLRKTIITRLYNRKNGPT
jgi:exo-1,4-beta-D-glucosaminidase